MVDATLTPARCAAAALLLGLAALAPAHAAKKAAPAASGDSPVIAPGAGCSMYGGEVLDVTGQSAVWLFIGERPVCADASRKQVFCTALQKREGYDTVREHGEQAGEAAEIAKSLPEEERRFFLQQRPTRALERALAACNLKADALRAKLLAETQARLDSGQLGAFDEDLAFLRREAPASVAALWQRECAGRVVGKSAGEMGMGIAFSGKPAYKTFCERTSSAGKDKTPASFAH